MTLPPEIKSVGFSLLERGEYSNQLEGFDYTKLTAINTCPTWGITRYSHHLRMPLQYEGDTRSMALEIGTASHEAFAAIRLAQLFYTYPEHARHHAIRVFGKDRASNILAVIQRADNLDGAIRASGVEAIISSGFEDSPWDKRRTLANMETSIIAYAANYDAERWPVWVANRSSPREPVGIEQPFAMLVTFLLADDSILEIRLTGKIDGLHWNREEGGEVVLHENKTGSRLDNAWASAFNISHQITGYCVAGSLMTGDRIRRAVVRGVQIPMPKMLINGLNDVWVTREVYHQERWLRWMLHTYRLYQQYKDDPINAPKYSHSCNRYFRPCPMIPMCYGDAEEQVKIRSEMVKDEWSPLSEEYDG
jgi:hypothetical protein